MAISHPLNQTANDQANEVFFCRHPEMVVNGVGQSLSATDPAHEAMRQEWIKLYQDILAHNSNGSKPFPDCPDAAHHHHPATCAHCAAPPVEPVEPRRDPTDDVDPVTPVAPCLTGALVVIVKDEAGTPVPGAVVFADGIGGQVTDASGIADFGEVPPDAYDIEATKDAHGPSSTDPVGPARKMAQSVPVAMTTVVDMVLHQVVTLTLTPEHPVACPGHPLKVTAAGLPAGGTYAWTATGHGAQLVTAAGAAATTGAELHMRCFKPNDANGEIPERVVTLRVTYTHPTIGAVTVSQDIKVHKITFVVANTAVTGGGTQATESAGAVQLGNVAGTATMSTDPDVTITLDPACPRKAACAGAHDLGWMQTVLTNTRDWHYSHTDWSLDPNFLPIRDQIGGPRPWYEPSSAFASDGDTVFAHHEDSPSQGVPWIDPRGTAAPAAPPPPPPANLQLTAVEFANGFHAWLVVRNTEWWAHDETGSFAYQRNFAWSCGLTIAVDTTQAVGSRCAPTTRAATIGAVGTGKGGVTPTITAPFPNTSHTVTHNP
jgi:hypothetical protein